MFRARLTSSVRRGLICNAWRRWKGSTRESFLTGTSGVYVEQMYEAWKANPNSVHAVSNSYDVKFTNKCKLLQSWNAFFLNVSRGATPGEAYQSPPTTYPSSSRSSNVGNEISEHLAIQALIRAYQVTTKIFLLQHSI